MIHTLLVLGLVASTIAGPINLEATQCAKSCTPGNKFTYTTGKTYEYAYEADTTTLLQGASEDQSGLHIRATAAIEVLTPCELSLKLKDVQLLRSSLSDPTRFSLDANSDGFKQALEAKNLRFAFQDGRIEDLCSVETEPEWVNNVKRGVLTAFQSSHEHLEHDHRVKEVDVTGSCQADLKITPGWRSVTVNKRKNLLACTDRSHHATSIQATPYRVNSDIQSLPLMKSTHECEQTIAKSGYLMKCECKENHVFRPFSNGESGATTNTRHSLEFKKETAGTGFSSEPTRRTTMIFSHDEDATSVTDSKERVKETLRDICQDDDTRPTTPRLFSELVYRLRDVDIATLRSIHNELHSERVCTENHDMAIKYFHDAIPMVSSSASVGLIRDVTMGEHLLPVDMDAWLSSLAFVSEPTQDMIQMVKPLFSLRPVNRNAMLAGSALIRTYCSKEGVECSTDQDIIDVLGDLKGHLGKQCEGEEELTILALKALSNIGVAGPAVSTMTRCAASTSIPVEVRLAAINGFHCMPCEQTRNDLMTIFRNVDEDAEIRIASYLNVMQCPDMDTLNTVRATLEGEVVNQVGSFVWTHLTNLMETSDPFKQNIRAILEDQTLKNEFDMDKRKFSRNYEGSLFVESLNMGAKVDSNLIWSQGSYVPRSAMLNLTTDLFGHSVNFLEIGGRVQGVERLVESLFGPEGYFPDNPVATALNRAKRAVRDDKMNAVHDSFDIPKLEDDLSGTVYMKMFGKELKYLNLDNEMVEGLKQQLNPFDMMINMANGGTYDYSKSYMFLDTTVSIPTVLGVPLRLSVNGTATLNLQIGGKLDMRRAMMWPSNMDINGYVKPSGAIELSSMMTMDAFVTKTGLKMVNTLHTSTQADVTLQIKDSKVFDAKVTMPKEKMEILDIQNEFFILDGENEVKPSMIEEGRVEKKVCSSEHVAMVTGLEICGELSYPNASTVDTAPHFPFTGPVTVRLDLNKADTHTGYELNAHLEAVRNSKRGPIEHYIGQIGFNTPMSTNVDREMLAKIDLDLVRRIFEAELRSPWNEPAKITADLNMKNLLEPEGSFNLEASCGSWVASYKSSLEKVVVDESKRWVPSIDLRIPGHQPITLSGYVDNQGTVDLTLNNAASEPIIVKGTFSDSSTKKAINIQTSVDIRNPFFNVNGNGLVEAKYGMYRAETNIAYSYGNVKESVSFKSRVKTVSNAKTYRKKIHLEFKPSHYPLASFNADVEYGMQGKELEALLNVTYGNDISNRIFAQHNGNYGFENNAFKTSQRTQVQIPLLNVEMSGKLSHRHEPNAVKTSLLFTPSPGQNYDFDLSTRLTSYAPLMADAEVTLVYPGREMIYRQSIEEKENKPGSYRHEMTVQWQRGSQITNTVDLIIGNTIELKSHLEFPNTAPIFISTVLIPVWDNFLFSGKVEYREQVYVTQIGYVIEWMKYAKVNLDVNLPFRKISGDASMTWKDNSFGIGTSLKWNVDRDSTAKLSLDGVLTLKNAEVDGYLKLFTPQRHYSAVIGHGNDGGKYTTRAEVSWDPEKRIAVTTEYGLQQSNQDKIYNAKLTFSSPFKYIDVVQGEVSFKQSADHNSLKTSLLYDTDKQFSNLISISMMNGMKHLQGKLELVTPFTSNLVTNANYNLDGSKFSSHIDATYGTETMDITFNGQSTHFSNLDASLAMTLPFITSQTIDINAQYNFQPYEATMILNAGVNGKKVELDVSGNLRNGNLRGQASLKLPIVGYEAMSLLLTKTSESGSHTFTTELSLAEKKISLNSVVAATSGHVTIQTPFMQLENAGVEWEYTLGTGKFNALLSANLNNRKGSIQVDHSHQLQSLPSKLDSTVRMVIDNSVFSGEWKFFSGASQAENSFTIKNNDAVIVRQLVSWNADHPVTVDASIYSPYLPFNEAAVNFIFAPNDQPASIQANLSWNVKNRISFNGRSESLSLNNMVFEGAVETTLEAFDSMTWSLHHQVTGSHFETDVVLTYPGGKTITAGVHLNEAFDLHFTSPCRFIRKFSANVTPKLITIEYDSESLGNIKLENSYTFNSIWDWENVLQVETPFAAIGNSQLTLSNTKENGKQIALIDLTYQFVNKISLEVSGMEDFSSGSVLIKTPANGYKMMYAGAGYKDMESYIKLVKDDDVIYAKSKLTLSPIVIAEISAETPFKFLQNTYWRYEHSGSSDDFSCQLSGTHNLLPGKVDGQFGFKFNGQRLEIITNIDAQVIKPMTVNIMAEGFKTGRYNTQNTIIYNGQTSSLYANANIADSSKVNLNIGYSCPGTREKSVTYSHALTPNNIEIKSAFNIEGLNKASAEVHLSNDRILEGSIFFNSAWTETAKFTLSHTGGLTRNFENEIRAVYGTSHVYALSTSLAMQDGMKARITTTTPYTNDISLAANVRGTLRRGDHEITLSVGDEAYRTSGSIQYDGSLTTELKMETPWEIVRQAAATLSFTPITNGFETRFTVSCNDKVYSHRTSVIQNDALELMTELTGPFVLFETLHLTTKTKLSPFEVSLDGRLDDKSLSVYTSIFSQDGLNVDSRILYNGQRIATTQVDIKSNPLKLVLFVETPFERVRQFSFESKHNGGLSLFNNEITAKLNGKKMQYDGEFNTNDGINGHFRLYTDDETAASLDIAHTGDMKNFRNSLTIATFGKTTTYSGHLTTSDSRLQLQIDLATPFNEYRNNMFTVSIQPSELSTSLTVGSHTLKAKGSLTIDEKLNHESMISYNEQRVVDCQITAEPNQLQFTMNTMYEPIRKLTFDGSFGVAESSIDITLNDQSLMAYRHDVSISSELHHGKFILTTGSERLSKVAVNFDNSIDSKTFRGSGDITVNGRTHLGYIASITTGESNMGKVSLTTSCPKMRELTFSYKFDFSESSASLRVDDIDLFQITANSRPTPEGMEARVSLETACKMISNAALQISIKRFQNSYTASGKVTVNSHHINGQVSLPIQLAGSPKHTVSASWDSSLEMIENGKFDFSLVNKPNIALLVKLEHTKLSFEVNVDLSLTNGRVYLNIPVKRLQDLTVAYNIERGQTFHVTISASRGTEFKGKLESILTRRPIAFNLKLSSNLEQDLVFNGNANFGPESQINLYLDTPMSGIHSVKVNFDYGIEGNQRTGKGNVIYNQRTIGTANWFMKGLEQFRFETQTIHPYARNINFSYRRTDVGRQAELRYNDWEPITFSYRLQGGHEINFELNTPYEKLENLEFEMSSVGNGQLGSTFMLKYNGQTYASGDFIITRNPNTFKARLASDFIQTTHFGIYTRSNGYRLEAVYGADNMYIDMGMSNQEVLITMSTPFSPMRSSSFKASFIKDSDRTHASAIFTCDKGTFELTGNAIRLPMIMNITMKTPLPILREASLRTNAEYVNNKLNSFIEASYNGKRLRVEAMGENGNEQILEFTLQTPFEGFESITVSGKNSFQHPSTVKSSLMVSYGPSNTFTAGVDLTMWSAGHLNIFWKGESIMAGFKFNPKPLDASVSFKSSITENLSVDLSFDGTALKLRNNYGSEYINLDLATDEDFGLQCRLQSSHPKVRDFSFIWKQSSENTHSSYSLSISKNELRTAFFEITCATQPQLTGTLLIETPFESLPSLKSEATINYNSNGGRMAMTIDKGMERLLDGSYEMTSTPDYSVQLSLTKPKQINASFRVNPFDGSQMSFRGKVNYEGKQGDLQSTLVVRPDIDLQMELQTPFNKAERTTFQAQMTGIQNGHNYIMESENHFGTFRLSGTTTYKPSFKSQFQMITPYENFRNVRGDFSIEKNNNVYGATLNLDNGQPMTVKGEFTFDLPARLSSHYEIQLPFMGLERMTQNTVYTNNGETVEFHHDVTAADGSSRVLNVVINKSPSFNIKADARASQTGLFRMQGEMTFEHHQHRAVFNFNSVFNDKTITANLEADARTNLVVTGNLRTPFDPVKDVSISLSHSTTAEKITTKASVNMTPSMIVSVDFDFNLVSKNGDLKIMIPSEFYMADDESTHETTITFNLVNNKKQSSAALSVTTPHPKLSKIGGIVSLETSQSAGVLKVSGVFGNMKTELEAQLTRNSFDASLTTPIKGWRSTTLSAGYTREGNVIKPRFDFNWSQVKRINVVGQYAMVKSAYKHSLILSLDVTTTFSQLQQLNANVQGTLSRSGLTIESKATHNGKTVLDAEMVKNTDPNNADKHIIAMTVDAPIRSSARIEAVSTPGQRSLTLTIKGLTNKPLELEISRSASQNARTFHVRAVIPTRTMIYHNEYKLDNEKITQGIQLAWDEEKNQKIGQQFTRVRSQSDTQNLDVVALTLDLPGRSFQLRQTTGSPLSRSSSASDVSLEFFWDATNDMDKKVQINHHLETSYNEFLQTLTLEIPQIRKVVVLQNEMKVNKNNVLFFGKTDLTYSRNPSEKLSLWTKIQDQQNNMTIEFFAAHPDSDFLLHTTTYIANDETVQQAGVNVDYMMANKQMNNMQLRGEIEKLKKHLNIQVSTPNKSYLLNGKMSKQEGSNTISFLAIEDHRHQVNTEMTVNPDMNTIEVKSYYSPENPKNMLHIFGKYMSPTELSLEAYRQQNGERITDMQISMEMKTKRMLNTKLFWHPNVVASTQRGLSNVFSGLKQASDNIINDVNNVILTEMNARHSLYQSVNVAAYTQFWNTEAGSLSADMEVILQEWERMKVNNDFYIQDMTRLFGSTFERFCNMISSSMNGVVKVFKLVSHSYQQICTEVAVFAETSANHLNNGFSWFIEMLTYRFQRIGARWQELREIISNRFVTFMDGTLQAAGPFIKKSVEFINNLNTYAQQFVESVFARIHSWTTRVKQHPYYVQMTQYNVISPVKDYADDLIDQYAEGAQWVGDFAKRHYDIVVTNPYTEFLTNSAKEYLSKVWNAYTSLEVERNARKFFDLIIDGGVSFVKKNALYLVEEYLQLEKDHFVTYEPQNGQVEFEVYIPTDVPSLQTVSMDFSQFANLYDDAKAQVQSLKPDFDYDYSIWDTYYKYKPSTDISKWTPPFDGMAMVIGGQHIMTFDGRHYDFASPCSYLLVSDFDQRRFSVVLEHQGTKQLVTSHNLVVNIDESEIQIDNKGKVMLNGVSTELPLSLGEGNTFLERQGDNVNLVSNHGLTINCDISNDVCTFKVSGWVFGKTGGLLGTYNHEPNDDFTTSDNKREDNVEKFARSWQVGKKCLTARNLVSNEVSATQKECEEVFKSSSSPMRACFKVVDPAPYMQMCMKHVSQGADKALCAAAKAYYLICRRHEVHVHTPKACDQCIINENQSIGSSEQVLVDNGKRTADVVFVVEESACNKDILDHVKNIAIKMELMSFKDLGLKNNRFGLVGYGGQGVHINGHSHTINGELFAEARQFTSKLSTLQMSEENTQGDVNSALKLAASYPTRATSAKVIVLVTCSGCSSNVGYLSSTLENQRIQLHVLTEHNFKSTTETPRTSNIFGVDKKAAFTASDVNGVLAGNSTLLGNLSLPSDSCSTLAHNSGGSTFDLNRLTSGRVGTQKRFIDVFVRRVASSASVPTCQVCRCMDKGNSICTPC